MKKMLKTVLCLVLIGGIVTGCDLKKKEQANKQEEEQVVIFDEKENNSEGIINEKELDGVKFSDTKVKIIGEETSFKTNVTNTTDSDINIDELEITLKDEEDNEVVKYNVYVAKTVAAYETIELESLIPVDATNAKTIEFKIIKTDN